MVAQSNVIHNIRWRDREKVEERQIVRTRKKHT